MLHISVLGPVAVERDGRRLTVPGGKTSELLVRLAVEAGTFVRTDRLLEDLWADEAVNTRRNTLQSKVARLRRSCGDARLIESGEDAYALRAAPSEVDALAVLDEAAAAAGLLDAGDDAAAAQVSAAGLARLQGEPLPRAGDWAIPHRARLDEARAELLETHLAARLRLGAQTEVVGELEAAVGAHPFREGLWELLITALYRAGRQADALAAYQRVRTVLADELGLTPGPRLAALEHGILVHDDGLGARAGNLPSLATDLVGRDGDVAGVTDLLVTSRLVEVLGPGGIGKTAVALAVGRGLGAADGVWLARLEAATTADGVLDAVVAALGVPDETALMERLRVADCVLILDNCEHVVDAAAALAVRLLDAAPRLRILCTSQVALDVEGEARFELAPLALSDAVELFARRATGRRAEEGQAVSDLCRSLDGLPLAIELAAARTKTLSIEEITRRLDDRFSVLSDPASRRPERRRALKATIQWSYELLFPDDKRGLWALAPFAGGAPLGAVESVLEALDVPSSAAIDVVGRLAARSLVIVEHGPEVRYRLLDSIRAFALEEMTHGGLAERARAAHAAWYTAAARTSTAGVRSAGQAEHLAFARAERANIDAALAWNLSHDPLRALDLVTGFGWAWIVLGDSRGAHRIHAALAAAGDEAPARQRAQALLLAAWIEASTDRLDLAREHIAEAAALDGGDDLQARCAYHLAYVVSHEGDFAQAMELTDRAASLQATAWDQAAGWLFAARAALSARDRDRALAARDEVEHWLQQVDDPWLEVRRDAMLGELARLEHRFEDAVADLTRAAETSERLGFRQTEAYQLSSLGRAQCQTGERAAGAATLERSIAKAERIGDVRLAALARVHLGRVLRGLGETARARTALEGAAAWHRAAGGGEPAALGECLLAALDAEDGVPGAKGRLDRILEDTRDDAPVEVFALDALARLADEAGDTAAAGRLAAAADRRMPAASDVVSELDRVVARPAG